MTRLLHTTLICALVGSTFGALFTDPSQIKNTTYDFIVVGAGTAGNVIAARLSENPSVSVLVVEAGVSNTGFKAENLMIPLFAPLASVNSPFDWNYTTVPQKALNNQILPYSRGYVLGGSSSTNFITWTRGSRDDFDRFAKVVGDTSYTWNNLFPYFKKSEKWVHPVDGRNDTQEYNPTVHGTTGPVLVSTSGNVSIIDSRVLQTTQQLSAEFPFNLDVNSGNPLGVGWLPSAAGGGIRSSSATAYLMPALNARKNLDVLIHTRATKLVQTGTANGLPQFRNVEVGQLGSSTRVTFQARKEIVLSAGAIGSPQILMLSGIGNGPSLVKVGIKPIVSLPEVGQNLQDHPIVGLQYVVPDDANTIDPITLGTDPNALNVALAQWTANRTGVLSSTGGNHIGFFRVPSNSSLLKNGDPSGGPTSAHFELAWQDEFASVSQTPPASGRYVSNIQVLNSPTSRGSVTLNSSDPFANPIIDPNFLSTDWDLGVMVYAIRSALRFIKAQAWSGFVLGPFVDSAALFADNATDADIITYIRKWTQSIKHPMCTAPANGASGKGVVDANLLVKNLNGVRIVDGSVFPFLPSAHPQAAIYGIAEMTSDKIKKVYGI
ncbi:aryl-alcohol-oxidase from pleurotus Eryingii [Crucibulum laeve]|uniref:pyranose dehydrogenase (acceptor) n=1 Tax=Crucibulum laeve TaxID=68775 RepID=A0A5C3M0R6_9AGAR|nr:aryl-alcohol-oxidase from pleurotus Eryingii [Crucibulum laeve]